MRYLLIGLGILGVYIGLQGLEAGINPPLAVGIFQSGVLVFALGLATVDIVAAVKGGKPLRGLADGKKE